MAYKYAAEEASSLDDSDFMAALSRAFEESEARFRLMVESVADCAIFMLDAGGRVASWNAGAERLGGYSADEVLGRHFSMFYPADDQRAGKPAAALRAASEEATGRTLFIETVLSGVSAKMGRDSTPHQPS